MYNIHKIFRSVQVLISLLGPVAIYAQYPTSAQQRQGWKSGATILDDLRKQKGSSIPTYHMPAYTPPRSSGGSYNNYYTPKEKPVYKSAEIAPGFGYGVFDYDYMVYHGNFSDHKRSGKGTLTSLKDTIYSGDWLNDVYEGKGVLIKDGRYEGEFSKGERSGQGTIVRKDRSIYTGQWKKDKEEGMGTKTYSNGDRYVGEWKEGNEDGYGKLTYANGTFYDGYWKAGSASGHGTRTYADGSRYEGGVKDGYWSGEGIYTTADGVKAIGSWVKSYPTNCKYKEVYPNGKTKLECTYLDSLMDGNTKWYYENGVLSEDDNYKKGIMDGASKQYFENGKTSMEVVYKNGILDGPFKSFYKNGNLSIVCEYRNGNVWNASVNNTPNGRPSGNTVKEGNGKVNNYYDDGKLRVEMNLKNGVLDGRYRNYYPNGRVWSDFEFKDGKLWNSIADNMPDGTPTGTYIKDGNGISMGQSPDGKVIIAKRTYVNGEMVKTEDVPAPAPPSAPAAKSVNQSTPAAKSTNQNQDPPDTPW